MTPTARTPRRRLTVAPREDTLYVLRITLEEVEPPVWRRVQVPGSITLERLHTVIQKAMGWRDVHLHEFEVGGRRYGRPEPDEPHYKVEPEWKLTLRAAAPTEGVRFRYVYDLGDGWGHEALVEAIQAPTAPFKHSACLAGERACPPEDCGGVPGYANLLDVLHDRSHPEHRDMFAWAGRGFDPERFNLAAVNRKLKLLK
ncbi:MAG TPA: plasmid pRiA4b ORF-3 family protein [Methylomirabilota bacterium]|nr:plasmid pRiA4b ORF-3 family protein [Methylomirabilota bacterium]